MFTRLDIFGKNAEKLKKLENKINKLDPERKYITEMNNYGNQLSIDVISNNSVINCAEKLLKKYLPESRFTFALEDTDNELYVTNDKELKNCYCITPKGIDYLEHDLDSSEWRAKRILQDLLKDDSDNIKVLINKLEESEYAEKLTVHNWNYIGEYL